MGTGFIDPHNPTDAITRYLSVLSPASADAPPPTTDPVDAAHVQALLRTASVVPTMNEEPGYQRSCRKGKGCVFGPAWTDDSDAALSHNGCDTRNDILRSQLTHVLLDNGAHESTGGQATVSQHVSFAGVAAAFVSTLTLTPPRRSASSEVSCIVCGRP